MKLLTLLKLLSSYSVCIRVRIAKRIMLYIVLFICPISYGGRHGRDRMVVGFTATFGISVYEH